MYLDHYLSSEFFVGKDQTLINALVLLFPERFITVWYNDPDTPAHLAKGDGTFLGQCSNEWFYCQFWLSDVNTRVHARFVEIHRLEVENMGLVAAKRHEKVGGYESDYDKRRVEKMVISGRHHLEEPKFQII